MKQILTSNIQKYSAKTYTFMCKILNQVPLASLVTRKERWVGIIEKGEGGVKFFSEGPKII